MQQIHFLWCTFNVIGLFTTHVHDNNFMAFDVSLTFDRAHSYGSSHQVAFIQNNVKKIIWPKNRFAVVHVRIISTFYTVKRGSPNNNWLQAHHCIGCARLSSVQKGSRKRCQAKDVVFLLYFLMQSNLLDIHISKIFLLKRL